MAHRSVLQEERTMTNEVDMDACEPPAVLPAQISEGARWDADTSGPRALMLAVLEDAVRCIEQGRRRRHFHTRRLAAEADAWVRCDRRGWPFSFVNICEVLGFDADEVRARLLTRPSPAAHRRRVGSSHPAAWLARRVADDQIPAAQIGTASDVPDVPRAQQ